MKSKKFTQKITLLCTQKITLECTQKITLECTLQCKNLSNSQNQFCFQCRDYKKFQSP